MAPLPRTLPPWRWNLGQHLCTPEAFALGPKKIPGLGEKNHSIKKENQALLCGSFYRLGPPLSTVEVGVGALGF